MKKIHLISKLCDKYPVGILKLDDSPDIIYAVGNLDLLNTFSLTVVGSRNYTQEAKVVTEDLVSGLTMNGVTIISGMARGIDTIAHEAAINAGGKTIAIICYGFIYAEDKKIFNKILANDGLILSEHYPDVPPQKFNYERRNKLLAAISDGTIVTEARENSGTLITADFANELNKPLYTFPWNIDDSNYAGGNYLLANGANCILSYKDVLKHYSQFSNINIKEEIKKDTHIPSEYLDIYRHLKKFPIELNQLAKKINMPFPELQYKITMMELEGLVCKMPNNSYRKNN